MKLEPISEEAVRTTAHILGSQSAAAQAIKNAEYRRAIGETVTFSTYKGSIFVIGEAASNTQEEK